MRRVVLALFAVVAVVAATLVPSPAAADTDPVDSLATSRSRVTTRTVGLGADGRVDLSANGQFVLFDRPGTGIGLFDSIRNQTVVLGEETAKPYAVSDAGNVVLYTNAGRPLRWNRATARSEELPWNGGLITDMAMDQTGNVIAYTERSGTTSGILRTWTAPSEPDESPRVRSFGAAVSPIPVTPADRDVFVSSNGRTALFRSTPTSIRGLDIASSTASAIPLTDLTGLDRAGVLQIEQRPSADAARFAVGGTTSTERVDVNFPAPNGTGLEVAVMSGDGQSVLFHSRDELYRWRTTGELTYLQPTQAFTVLGTLLDASITGRFVLTGRPAPGGQILEIVEVGALEIPIIDVVALQGAQLSDQVRRLYIAYFDREPDAVGGQAWRVELAKGADLNVISQAFASSTEFQNTYGALDDPAFVDLVYQNVLGRPADADGRAFWISRLASGASRGSVMTGFSEATEFRNRTATSTPIDSLSAPKVERLYRAYFDRSADQGGLDFWLEQFAAGADLGTISREFATSTEFQNTYGSLDDSAFVDLVYNNVLGRAPDDAGRAFWLGQLTSGALNRGQVMVGFSESVEFIISTDTVP